MQVSQCNHATSLLRQQPQIQPVLQHLPKETYRRHQSEKRRHQSDKRTQSLTTGKKGKAPQNKQVIHWIQWKTVSKKATARSAWLHGSTEARKHGKHGAYLRNGLQQSSKLDFLRLPYKCWPERILAATGESRGLWCHTRPWCYVHIERITHPKTNKRKPRRKKHLCTHMSVYGKDRLIAQKYGKEARWVRAWCALIQFRTCHCNPRPILSLPSLPSAFWSIPIQRVSARLFPQAAFGVCTRCRPTDRRHQNYACHINTQYSWLQVLLATQACS